jgi:hypothetical protein
MWLDQKMWRPPQNISVTAQKMKDNFTPAACGSQNHAYALMQAKIP